MKKFIVGLVVGIFLAVSGVAVAAQSIKIFVNGLEVHSDVPAQIVGGRTMVPLAAVSKALGADVKWDGSSRSVFITASWLPSNTQGNTVSGGSVTGGNVQVTVTKTERSSGDDWNKPKDGKEYYIVHLTLKNNGASKAKYNPYDFSIKDSNGNITQETFTIIDKDTSLNMGELAPSGTVSGTIAFEVPKGDSGLTLIYEYEYNKEVSLKLTN